MAVARHYSASKGRMDKEPSWLTLILTSGVLTGLLLFTMAWYFSLPDLQKDAVIHKIMSAGDIFPGILGFDNSQVLLVMGVDMPPQHSKDDYSMVRTDTMMLVKLDKPNRKVNIVSIPRDCKVFVAGDRGINKINAAFTLGGPQTAVQTVEQTFGVKVDHYLVMNLHGIRDVVDAVGGVDIFVEKPMQYRDYTAKLFIDLQPGRTHMDGRTAEGFLRFRHDAYGDIGRIRRQQQFIAAMSAKLKEPAILLKVKPLIEASNKFLLTDMPPTDLVRLALFGKDLDKSSFQVATVPGAPSQHSQVSYWIIDPVQAEAVLNRMIVGLPPESPENAGARPPSVGILYTPEHQAELSAYAEKLQAAGYQVRCRGRLPRSASKVVIHNQRYGPLFERKLLRTHAGLDDVQLIFSPHGATFESNACGATDFTVILGDDTRSAATP